jgi:hypothetical protein
LVPDGSRDGRDPDLLIEVLKRVNFIVRQLNPFNQRRVIGVERVVAFATVGF